MKARFSFPELGLASFFLVIGSWYLLDAYRASSSSENMLLILPAAIVVIGLCLWIIGTTLYRDFRRKSAQSLPEKEKLSEEKSSEKKPVSVLGAMSILACFVLSMDWIGFDVATFLFMFALMFLQGERRLFWLGGFSLIFAVLVSLFFEYMIPYPMPMLLGREFLERLI
jgi:ABC-type sugar transport system permease subunit